MNHSSAVGKYLSHLLGEPVETTSNRRTIPLQAGPRATRLKDPLEDAETALDEYDGTMASTRANGYLKRQRGAGQLQRRASGNVTFEGRICCVEFLRSIDRRLHLLRLPYDTGCPDCGAKYRIEMGVTQNGR